MLINVPDAVASGLEENRGQISQKYKAQSFVDIHRDRPDAPASGRFLLTSDT